MRLTKLFSFILTVSILALVTPAMAQSDGLYWLVPSTGSSTNNVAAPATNTYTTSIAVSDQDYVGLDVSFTVNGGTANALTNRVRVDIFDKVGTAYNNTAPFFSVWISPTVTNTVYSTNIFVRGRAAIGNIVIANTNALTTSYITNVVARLRVAAPKRKID